MKRSIPWMTFILCVIVLLCTYNLQAQVRAFTPRYTNPSVRGNIKFVSNSIITTNGATTSEAPPGGTSTNNNGPGINIDIDNTNTTLILWNSTWKFCDSGYSPGAGTWKNPAYPDAGWVSATAGLPAAALRDIGYGDADQVTPYIYAGCGARPAVVNPGCGTKYITTYFRRQFTIASVAAFTGFQINIHRDDGAVIYINGTEISRTNMPQGTIANNTTALVAVDGTDEDTTIFVSTANFVNGTNTIAVELHQQSASSSDISFRLELIGVHDNGTFSSSSADLNVNSCSEVLWAGLYWGASLGNSARSTWRTGHTSIKFKRPGAAAYTTVTAAQTDIHDSSAANNHTGYQCFADVTSLLNTLSPNGTYTIADVVTPMSTGITNEAAGWTLVIAYRDPTTIPRNLVVFDGFEIVSVNSQKDVPIAGFLTPLAGPVSCELGVVCYDGDRGSTDGWFFKQDSAAGVGTYTDLSGTGTNGASDSWNSTISYFGANVTTRNPNNPNTLGYDADIIQLPNAGNTVLGNNRTSARIRISSPSGGENFFLQVVTSSISVSNPSFTLIKTATDLSGGAWQGGDSLQYRLISDNRGIDTSTSTILIDTLPGITVYKPGSLVINGVSKTDAAGDDEAEYDPIGHRVIFRLGTGATPAAGGQIIPNRKDTVSFKVNAVNSCGLLACNAVALNQGHIFYVGKHSLQSLSDNSGYIDGSGCFVEAPISNTVSSSCFLAKDTSLVNQCPSLTVTLPSSLYNGFTFYSAMPFIPANQFNPATVISVPHTYYAYYDAGTGCSDTVRFIVLMQPCPDIDDDDDGIPDVVESNGFDAFADDDLDGIPNFADPSFAGYADSNNDGVNDNLDSDLDGIPNQVDRDSDNDGIPDVVEAGGVDANGDGRIDNFTDTDNDGLSQNVDASNTGAAGSGNGLGLPDLDGDGIPNYIDLDSDNDGIPDIREVNGTDANNDARVDGYTDNDGDGYADAVDGDVGNDNVAENFSNALLRSGVDGNGDGRADSYPNKNFDSDTRANPYDLDSDNDGVTDVREAGFTDANSDGFSDGVKGADGWDDTIDALGTLTVANSDANGNANYIDIDSDNDGIPDNIEAQSTSGYALPAYADTDGDGIDNQYDGFAGFGGNGITPNDQDADSLPDYVDTDTDGDGVLDIIEGNDFNLNNIVDDLVTLTGVDTDGDGLDDRFDANNSSIKGTALYMGAGGSFSGDGSPGSLTMVQRTLSTATDRDWRFIPFLLDASFINFSGSRNAGNVKLHWVVTCDKIIDHFDIERSTDGVHFEKIGQQQGIGASCHVTPFDFMNDISAVGGTLLYYRINAVCVDGSYKKSNYIIQRLHQLSPFTIAPNPASTYVAIGIAVKREMTAYIRVLDATGKILLKQNQALNTGYNSFPIQNISQLHYGVYTVQVKVGDDLYNEKLVIRK